LAQNKNVSHVWLERTYSKNAWRIGLHSH